MVREPDRFLDQEGSGEADLTYVPFSKVGSYWNLALVCLSGNLIFTFENVCWNAKVL